LLERTSKLEVAMERVDRLRDWVESQRDLAFEIVRIFLGLVLFAQGVYFVSHVGEVRSLLDRGGVHLDFTSAVALGHYVALAHLGGGFLLALGMMTRLAAAVQIPVLLGAVFLVHLRAGLFGPGQNLELAVLVLLLLALCVFHGGGRLSVDAYLTRHLQPPTEPVAH
jgi:putative oxidoreductase